jgi:hypothetical protein
MFQGCDPSADGTIAHGTDHHLFDKSALQGGERASNKADIAYLYYLPFAMVFASGDKLHQRTAPLFLNPNQSYVESDELKPALRELDEYYDRLPEEIKQRGVLPFAHYPPPTIDNTVTQLWDKHMRPDWRKIAKGKEAEVDKASDEAQDRLALEAESASRGERLKNHSSYATARA